MGAALSATKDLITAPEENINISGLEFTRSEVEDAGFTEKQSERIAKKLAGNIYYTAFYPENRVMDLSETGEIAEKLVESWNQHGDARLANGRLSRAGYDYHWVEEQEVQPSVREFIEELESECDDQEWKIRFDTEDLYDELVESIGEILQEEDDSEPTDLLSSCDRAEMAFILCDPNSMLHISDQQIETDRYSDWKEIAITRQWIDTLARLGYTLSDYRKHSGNKRKSECPRYRPSKRRRHPIITMDKLEELVTNSCSSYFHIGLYGIFPLKDMMTINPGIPLILKGCQICVIDTNNGTFYDVPMEGEIISIDRNDGKWVAFPKSGPVDWCCMSPSYYQSEIKN